MERIICKLATGEISIFWLVPVAEETGLKVALSETPKTGFVATRPNNDVVFKPVSVSCEQQGVGQRFVIRPLDRASSDKADIFSK